MERKSIVNNFADGHLVLKSHLLPNDLEELKAIDKEISISGVINSTNGINYKCSYFIEEDIRITTQKLALVAMTQNISFLK